MANPAIVVDFIANTKDLQSGFREASGHTSKFGDKLKGLAKTGALAGMAALAATVKVGVGEFMEASKVSAQTESVLKSTGKAAGVTSKQVQDLAGSLMKKTGIDDEAIQSGENLLLTFTNIRNEAGKGNDIFNQSTKIMTDMSVALGQDMKTSAIQLGKALNNPIKGITALQRVGVSFTDAQKEQIKKLQESGHTMEAQKLILAELNKEFGGSAEAAGKTLPGQLNILKETFNNLAGTMVGAVIPVLEAFAKILLDHKTVVIALAAVLGTLMAATLAISAATAAWNTIQVIASGAAKAWAAAQWLVNVALEANPIGLVVVAIAALVAALIIAYKTSDTFRNIVDGAFNAVADTAKKAFKIVTDAAVSAFNWIRSNWPLILGILGGPIAAAVVLIVRNWDTITDGAKDAVHGIQTAFNALVAWLAGNFKAAVSGAAHAIGSVFDFIADGARDAYAAVQRNLNGLVNFIEGIVGKVSSAAHSVANAIKGPINAVIRAWNSIEFKIPTIKIPSVKIGKKKIGGGTFGGGSFGVANIPELAAGGIVTAPTLALIGEAGPEAVVPLNQAQPAVEVRVFIGETELRGMVRTEVAGVNGQMARTLMAGGVR